MPFTVTLFGPIQVLVGGRPLPPLRSRKALWLLALLTLRHHAPVEREWLASMLWPDSDRPKALGNLRTTLSELKMALGPEGQRLTSPSRHTACINLQGAVVDLVDFDRWIASGNRAELEQAVALYCGPLLDGSNEEWVHQDRGAREQDCLRALQALGESALTAGDYRGATGWFRRAVALDPWWDAAHRGLMDALAKDGDLNEALQVYRNFENLVRGETGAIPDEQTTALYTRLRTEARKRSQSPSPAPVDRTTTLVSGNLPHALTGMVGRDDEKADIALALRKSRLVTLTGLGGIGKTRLAVDVAGQIVSEYPDGVWLVSLESISDGNRVVQQIADVLDVAEIREHRLLDTLIGHVRNKRLVLVLDNCEHVVQEAAGVAASLLLSCGGLRILATSREALGVTGEVVWSVPALVVPDIDHLPSGRTALVRVLMGYESVQLFVERTQAVHRGFTMSPTNAMAIARICARVEGIPLAIELAAGQVKSMSVEEISKRLDDYLGLLVGGSRVVLPRQKTLRATFDWSYALLSERERVLLGRLSVFAGGWRLAAAEQVCADEGGSTIQGQPVQELLSTLVDKSLVMFGSREVETGGRYRLLETVRQYAAELLGARNETVRIRDRHLSFFLNLSEEAEPQLTDVDQGTWLEGLEGEHDNLRAALDWCRLEDHESEAGLRLAGALGRFWELHGYYNEGRAALAEALKREGAELRTDARAKALNSAGVLAYYQGDLSDARIYHEEGLEISREIGNCTRIAWALNDLGDVYGALGDDASARKLYDESLAIFRELGNQRGIASLLHHLGRLVRDRGEYDRASEFYGESLAIQRELGNKLGVAWTLHHLGNLAGLRGDAALAWSLQEESLAAFRELGNRQGAAWSLSELGSASQAQGNHEGARILFEEAVGIFQELGNRQGVARVLCQQGRLAVDKKELPEARRLHEESLAIRREMGIQVGVADSLWAIAELEFAEGRIDKAARLWGAVDASRQGVAVPMPIHELERNQRIIERARLGVGESVFSVFWLEGSSLNWEEAVEGAMSSSVQPVAS